MTNRQWKWKCCVLPREGGREVLSRLSFFLKALEQEDKQRKKKKEEGRGERGSFTRSKCGGKAAGGYKSHPLFVFFLLQNLIHRERERERERETRPILSVRQ